jgi:predicted nucleic acid-binding protein
MVVAFLNGNALISRRIRDEIDEISLSTLVIAELDYGAKISKRSKENLEKLYRFLDVVQIVPFDVECAKIFGTIKGSSKN